VETKNENNSKGETSPDRLAEVVQREFGAINEKFKTVDKRFETVGEKNR